MDTECTGRNGRRGAGWAVMLCLVVLVSGVVGGCLSVPVHNNVLSELRSPDGLTKAVLFERDGGATTGFSRQVSILPAADPLPDEPGNVFVMDDNDGAIPGPALPLSVMVTWKDDQNVQINYDRRGRTFKKHKEIRTGKGLSRNGVYVSYRQH